jgi:hypothetical protein
MDCPNASPECKYFKSKHGCRTNIDHYYWPARDYTTPIEKEFRELPENKDEKCMAEHDERHRTERPPQKPSRDEMLLAIQGIRSVLRETT